MRKLIFQVMVSLDGFYEGPGHDISWHYVDEEFNNYAIGLLNQADMLLFGRITYELMAGYWPTPEAARQDPVVAAKMNGLPKLVFSQTLRRASWHHTRLVQHQAAVEVARLKLQPGRDMVILGSSQLALSFIPHGLIDEFRIVVSPVTIGKGTRLFSDLPKKLSLHLTGTRTFHSGNVLLCYKPNLLA